ncbi:hypothetical protein Tco_1127809 [Tanacetum coccineum]
MRPNLGVLHQESKKSPKEIIRAKKEQGEEKQDSTYSIRSTDKVDLEEFDLKSTLFKHMNKIKSANRNTANYRLYYALMEALIADEDAMDKEVADKVKDHKRKHDSDDDEDDDDDEGPSAGSNQGRSTKRRRSDSAASGSLTQEMLKPIPESERPATPEPEWTIPPNDFPEPENNWANTYATAYKVPEENKLQRKTYDIGSFIKWFCRRTGKKKLCKADLEGPAFNLVKAFHKNNVFLQYQMDECHKLLTNKVDLSNPEGHQILRNIYEPLPLGGPPGQVTIQPQLFFNKDLDYLLTGDKERKIALSISKLKAARYLEFGLEELVPSLWVECECEYDISAAYGITHWWFRRKEFYINKHSEPSDREAVRSQMRILSVISTRASIDGTLIIADHDPASFLKYKRLQIRTTLNPCPQDKNVVPTARRQIRPTTRERQLAVDPEMCMFALTVSIVEPKNIKEAMADSAWIKAMQDELHQFDRLNVWELVDKPFGKMVIKLKWLMKEQKDDEQKTVNSQQSTTLLLKAMLRKRVIDLKKLLLPVARLEHFGFLLPMQCTQVISNLSMDCENAEAEYVALSASCAQVMWMRTQLQDYGFNYNKIPLYCDSQSAIAISCNPVQHSHTKHIHTRPFREDKCLIRRENQCFIVLLSGALFQPHRRRDILSFMSITKRVFKRVEIFDQRGTYWYDKYDNSSMNFHRFGRQTSSILNANCKKAMNLLKKGLSIQGEAKTTSKRRVSRRNTAWTK